MKPWIRLTSRYDTAVAVYANFLQQAHVLSFVLYDTTNGKLKRLQNCSLLQAQAEVKRALNIHT